MVTRGNCILCYNILPITLSNLKRIHHPRILSGSKSFQLSTFVPCAQEVHHKKYGSKRKKGLRDEVLYGFIIIILLTPIFPGLFSRVHT